MTKMAQTLSIVFHPLFLSFYNFLFFIALSDAQGAVLGFLITLFFLAGVMIPVFYTVTILYKENKTFEWSQLTNMGMSSRKKLLVYTIIYHVIFLLFVINLNEVFLGHHKPMFASVIMGFIFSMMLSFVLHLVNIKNSLHGLGAAFFVTFNVIFWWKVPGLELSLDHPQQSYFFASAINLIILTAVIWARLSLKAHKNSEMAYGIIIVILSPLLLTLLTYAI